MATMKPRVRIIPANHLGYPHNAIVFVPGDNPAWTRIGGRNVIWYQTVRAMTIDGLCNGVTEVSLYAPRAGA